MVSGLLTTRQVADRLGVNVRRVHTLVTNGVLVPASRLDGPRGALFFLPEAVSACEARFAAEAEAAREADAEAAGAAS